MSGVHRLAEGRLLFAFPRLNNTFHLRNPRFLTIPTSETPATMNRPANNKLPVFSNERELLHYPGLISPQPYYDQTTSYPSEEHNPRAPIASFHPDTARPPQTPLHPVWNTSSALIALFLGVGGSLSCYGFTYWLSRQTFSCPAWALYCSVPPRVTWIAAHMGTVQGVISALYSVFISMIAYVAHALAETTLWPAMTRRSFRMSDIDNFLQLARGSLPALPQALWHSARGGFYNFTTMALTGLLVLLLFSNSIFIGHAYTIEIVPTRFFSNFTQGAGIGFDFEQWTPPGSAPGSVGNAAQFYTSWAMNTSIEPLPDLRDFIIERRMLSKIGNATINAVRATRNINCSAYEINITQDVTWTTRLGDVHFKVATHIPDEGDSTQDDYYALNNDYDQDGFRDINIRIEPYLSVWVDQYYNTSLIGAVTRLVFAAVNGTIEGGFHTPPTSNMNFLAGQGYVAYPYSGIDSLACDVAVEFEEAQACIGTCDHGTNVTLMDFSTLSSPLSQRWSPGPRVLWDLAVWFAAVPTTFGISVFGAQPMYGMGDFPDASIILPVAQASTSKVVASYWTQANLTHFIDVAAGAFGITLTDSFPMNVTGNATVVSTLGTPRLNTNNAWLMLIPICYSVGTVLLLGLLSYFSHRAANVHNVRVGRVGDIVVSAQTEGIRSVVDQIRSGMMPLAAIDDVRLRYGIVPDGHDGLGGKGEVRPL